jgi:hypothetical protein
MWNSPREQGRKDVCVCVCVWDMWKKTGHWMDGWMCVGHACVQQNKQNASNVMLGGNKRDSQSGEADGAPSLEA